ncbi:MAG: hypothetical protein LBF97_04540, partial [Elusimicrobiota bacterium]|nr:hypothetical protein [Elusimicrobiota bacterium]
GIDFLYDEISNKLFKAKKEVLKMKNGNLKKFPFLIHEYPSLSTGKLAKIKTYLKKRFNTKPNLRIFLNENVKNGFNFDDDIDFIYRDMGILKLFFEQKETKKEYDFVYIGEINFDREIDRLLKIFTEPKMKDFTILLIGKPNSKIYKKFNKYKNIHFTGAVNYSIVPLLASKAVYGINWRPNKYPHNLQTSTKFLEYCALDLKIISLHNDYSNEFAYKNGIKFYNINEKIDNFDIDKIKNFEYNSFFDKIKEFEWLNYLNKIDLKGQLLKALKKNVRN